jgi:hypothetical protein
MTGVPNSVRPTDTMAAHFRKINQRLASLERASSSGGGGGGVPTDWTPYDARFVNVPGDRMSGTLELLSPVESLRLGRSGATTPHFGFYDETFATRYGYIMGTPTDMRIVEHAGVIALYPNAVKTVQAQSDGLFVISSAVNPGNIVVGPNGTTSTGARIRLHVPTSGNIVYCDFAGWGAAGTEQMVFRAGTAGVLQLEDTVMRSLKAFYSAGQGRFAGAVNPLVLTNDANGPYMAFYDGATVDAIGARKGYVGFASPTSMYLNNETAAGSVFLDCGSGGLIVFRIAGVEQARWDAGGILNVGRTSNSSYYTDAGCDLRPSGQWLSTISTVNAFPWLVRIGAALATSQRFLSFRTATSGTGVEIGSITIGPAINQTAYNTTSHGPFKGNVHDLDDDEAIERVMRWRPISHQWKLDDEGIVSEEGEPQGDEYHGFIAQEMHEVNPHAVTPGYGTWAEHVAWRELAIAYGSASQAHADWEVADENERGVEPDVPDDPGDDPFQGWQGDWTYLVPDLSAAVQALIRQNRALTARIAQLEGAH